VKDIQTFLLSAEFDRKMSYSDEKMKDYEDAVAKQLTTLENSPGKKELDKAIRDVSQAATGLKNTLAESVPQLNNFLEHCNDFFTGTGPNGEYLHSVCRQKSAACFEKDNSRHIACCCAYNPAAMLGAFEPKTHQINGGSAVTLSRRLAASTKWARGMDICASAWTNALQKVTENWMQSMNISIAATEAAINASAAAIKKDNPDHCDMRGKNAGRVGQIKEKVRLGDVTTNSPTNAATTASSSQATVTASDVATRSPANGPTNITTTSAVSTVARTRSATTLSEASASAAKTAGAAPAFFSILLVLVWKTIV
jgi:hypothetical protein